MACHLQNRSLLSLMNHTEHEIRYLIDLAKNLKKEKHLGTEQKRLTGKNIVLIFEKTSTRTRCAFEVTAYDQGAHITYIDSKTAHIGKKETIKDTARVLGRMYDAIQYRGFEQTIVEEFAHYAGVPVFNGLTNEFHPTQVLADVMTMCEFSEKPLQDISYAYMGDARYNMGNSLLMIGAKLGMDVRIAAPKAFRPSEDHIRKCTAFAEESGARLLITEDIEQAVKNVDFIHTDVWVSMGEPVEAWEDRIKSLFPYQVNSDVLAASGNSHVKFMHCLPAFHDADTTVGQEVAEKYPFLANGIEVTKDVFDSSRNICFEQAENRLHSIKAVLVSSLG